ncbi:MAG: mechanosensitive ion channel family protein [Xanthomonadales bacterium]|nr:mechanosensitive ion channel family protein [Xanthomonadales bacterium]
MQDPQTTPPASAPDSDPATDLSLLIDPASWLPEPLQPLWGALQDYPFLRALGIALIGLLAAYLVRWVFRSVASRLAGRTKTDVDDKILLHVSRPIFLSVFYGSLCLAMISLGVAEQATTVVVRVLLSLMALVWMVAGFRVSRVLLASLARHKHRFEIVQDRTIPLFDIVSKLLVVLLGSYVILQIWNIDATAWLASAGVVGIAVGFAAKDTLANLFSGVFIVVDTPYKLGDYVNLDSGERGMVTHVGMRSTRILTRDDIEITIPNAVIANEKIVNESAGRWVKRRLRIKVGAAYGSDLDLVCDTLMQVARDNSDVCQEPPARVRMRSFGDSAIDFELLCWIDHPEDRGKITHDLLMAVYRYFQAADIEIPYSKHDLYIKEMPSATTAD